MVLEGLFGGRGRRALVGPWRRGCRWRDRWSTAGEGRREPRAAGAGRAVTVAAQLEAEEGAQSSDLSAMRRGWSAERREGVAGKSSADGSWF